MKHFYISLTVILLGIAYSSAQNADKIDFVKQIKPILEGYCVSCHNPVKASENGDFDLSTKSAAEDSIVPGNAAKSKLFKLIALDPSEKKLMPPKEKGGPLQKVQIETLRKWIDQGADWPAGLTLKTAMRIDFVRDVQPILEKGGPLDEESKEILRLWLDQGAVWPADAKLAGSGQPVKNKEMEIVEEIHKKIMETSKEKSEGEMKPFTESLTPDVAFDMVPIRSGEFVMGSPQNEKGRNPDEGPQHKVKIDAFWMGKCEVTWDEYELFLYPTNQSPPKDTTYKSDIADITAHPTRPYVEMSFGMGKSHYPTISMTQHAANKYCQWLSAKTGHFYRLPTEAEWEYACRAGTTTAYSFGDDPGKIGEYAWFTDNSDFKYQRVGKKKLNPWGLYDMHGNVAEWCLDQYAADYYGTLKDAVTVNPWNKATKPYPHVARGGSWDDDPAKLRSAVRRFSDKAWKRQDPQLPKSIWWLTDAQFLGIRVVRPLKVSSPEELYKYWNNGVERE